nr:uncharacterized protein LOC113803024 [Penaeus vannamei]
MIHFRQQSTDSSRRRPADSVQADTATPYLGRLEPCQCAECSMAPVPVPGAPPPSPAPGDPAYQVRNLPADDKIPGIAHDLLLQQVSVAGNLQRRQCQSRSEAGLPERAALGTAFPSPLIRARIVGIPGGSGCGSDRHYISGELIFCTNPEAV